MQNNNSQNSSEKQSLQDKIADLQNECEKYKQSVKQLEQSQVELLHNKESEQKNYINKISQLNSSIYEL